MATVLESNKTKIAKRVIEVFEFFARNGDQATVMDIVRSYGRPQSSTSELLASLVEMGLLYKDARARSYSPTPRLAALGGSAQPQIIRNGRLFNFMDRLGQASGCGVALFGMVGTHVQIFRWVDGGQDWADAIGCGSSELLSSSAAGLLMLSTLDGDQAHRMLWRLNADAPTDEKFSHADLRDQVAHLRVQRDVVGTSGFIANGTTIATLLPCAASDRPLALGVIYPNAAAIDVDRMLARLKEGVVHCASEAQEENPLRESMKLSA